MNKQTYLMWRMGRVSHNWVGKNGTNLHNFWVRNIGLFPWLCQDKPLTYLYSEIWVSIPQHPFSEILLRTLLREIAIYISVEGGNRKKLKNKKEWVWPRGGRRVLFLEITQSPMNFLFFCFCRRWISSLRRQFFEWLPHFKNAGPFFTILLQAALTLRNKAHIAKIRQGTVLLIRNCQSSISAIFIFT